MSNRKPPPLPRARGPARESHTPTTSQRHPQPPTPIHGRSPLPQSQADSRQKSPAVPRRPNPSVPICGRPESAGIPIRIPILSRTRIRGRRPIHRHHPTAPARPQRYFPAPTSSGCSAAPSPDPLSSLWTNLASARVRSGGIHSISSPIKPVPRPSSCCRAPICRSSHCVNSPMAPELSRRA